MTLVADFDSHESAIAESYQTIRTSSTGLALVKVSLRPESRHLRLVICFSLRLVLNSSVVTRAPNVTALTSDSGAERFAFYFVSYRK